MQEAESLFGENPQDVTRLEPELQQYLVRGEWIGLCLKHPLVYQVPFFSWKIAIEMFNAKQSLIAEYLASGEFDSALWLYERPYRISTLYDWWTTGLITNDQLREILPHAWMDTEEPEQFGSMPLEMFEALGYVSDAKDVRLEGELIVYRGASRKGEVGIEWSLSRDVAEWFARRWPSANEESWLTTAKVKAEHVLAYLTGRSEEEIIVNPVNVEIICEKRIPNQREPGRRR